jgi:DEAD/DEAH box helicase domain-containing protein
VVVATGTSSGKSLCYQIPAVEAALKGRTTLMLFPTKALAHDQLASLVGWAPKGVTVAAYDGDCSMEERNWVRSNADIILTNPEMLHLGILANHRRWERFLHRLDFVVVDELHALKGIFGSHVSHVLRRLRRLVSPSGHREPTFAFTSATIGAPGELAGDLCGLPVEEVTNDCSPIGSRTTVLWNPQEHSTDPRGRGAPSLNVETATLAAELVRSGLRTLVFCRSRRSTELVASDIRSRVSENLRHTIRSYRAGYLVEERREIEVDLAGGALTCVVATNALELGIDIGGLDAVVMAGFPGTTSSFRQQLGRCGRSGRESLAILIAGEDQLDQWLMRHPTELFERAPEPSVVNPSNPHVLHPHLGCAADELPLRHCDERLWHDDLAEGIRDLVLQDRLSIANREGEPVACWAGRGAPAPTIGLRSASRGEYAIRGSDQQKIGTVDSARVSTTVHVGAVYLHQGAAYEVVDLDHSSRTATVKPVDGSLYSQVRSDTSIRLVELRESTSVQNITAHLGRVEVTTTVTGFVLKDSHTHRTVEHLPLEPSSATLDTTATWWVFGHELVDRAGVDDHDLPGALHAIEHAGIGILPLFAICDRWDVGGVSTPWLPETDAATVVIHDAHPGGSGVAPMAYSSVRSHLLATHETLRDCPCEMGCPACVQSPKCGNGNEPLHKLAASRLITHALNLVD